MPVLMSQSKVVSAVVTVSDRAGVMSLLNSVSPDRPVAREPWRRSQQMDWNSMVKREHLLLLGTEHQQQCWRFP